MKKRLIAFVEILSKRWLIFLHSACMFSYRVSQHGASDEKRLNWCVGPLGGLVDWWIGKDEMQRETIEHPAS